MFVYEQRPEEFLNRYERLDTEEIHDDWLSLLPTTQLLIARVSETARDQLF